MSGVFTYLGVSCKQICLFESMNFSIIIILWTYNIHEKRNKSQKTKDNINKRKKYVHIVNSQL